MPEEVERVHKYSSFKLCSSTEIKAVKEAFKHVVLEGALVTLLNTGIVHSINAKPGSLLTRCDISVHWVTVRVNAENRHEITN
jgi:hypothetical protein